MTAKRRISSAFLALACLLALPAAANDVRIVVLGDSLTAGYGLALEEAFPARLAARLEGAAVLDAGVSGDTSAGGLARLDWVLGDRPSHVIVALGANDGLRGIEPAVMEANLAAILQRLADDGIPALLAGMLAPPNMGSDYTAEFNAVFPRLAERFGVPLYAFFLDGVAAQPALLLEDGLHPNAAGADEIARRMAPMVRDWLAQAEGQ